MTGIAELVPLTKDALLGAWQMTSWTYEIVETGEKRDALGANPRGFSLTGHARMARSGHRGVLSICTATNVSMRLLDHLVSVRERAIKEQSVQERSSRIRAPSLQNCASGPPRNSCAMRRYRRRRRCGRTIRT